MAFVAGDTVCIFPVTKSFGEQAAMLGGGGVPLLGKVDAVASPSVRVTWGNGITTQYLDDGAQLLAATIPAPNIVALLHTRVRIGAAIPFCNNPANAKGQGASEGLVIAVATIGGNDFVVVKFSAGDVALAAVALVS